MYAKLERKVCLQCREEKSLDLFRKRKKRSNDTYESYCKTCEKFNNQKWYIKNKQEIRNRDFIRNCLKFGLSVADYNRMVKEQDGKCVICNKPETNKRGGVIKNLAIDHCHKTGKIRSLLCNCCNTAIGLLKEDMEILEAAIKYLDKFKR